jgi:L-asparaginase II
MPSLPRHAPLVVTTRGGTAECVHHGSIAVVDRAGRLIAGAGDPSALNFTRSTLKPFQALPFLEDGGMEHFRFTSHALALMCASHNGETVHVSIVRQMLDCAGAGESSLQCGPQVPVYFAATGRTPPPGMRRNQLHHNCSGKHAGFIAYCRMHQQPLQRYLSPNSPLQKRIRASIARLAPGAEIATGTDGCGAPNYALPLDRIAHLYCRLASDSAGALSALRFAMTRHPDLVSGTGRADLVLMRAGGGDWLAKGGAGGLLAIGVRSRNIGIAIRIADGDAYALQAATLEALRQLGLSGDSRRGPLAAFAHADIRDNRGRAVGRLRPVFRLRSP